MGQMPSRPLQGLVLAPAGTPTDLRQPRLVPTFQIRPPTSVNTTVGPVLLARSENMEMSTEAASAEVDMANACNVKKQPRAPLPAPALCAPHEAERVKVIQPGRVLNFVAPAPVLRPALGLQALATVMPVSLHPNAIGVTVGSAVPLLCVEAGGNVASLACATTGRVVSTKPCVCATAADATIATLQIGTATAGADSVAVLTGCQHQELAAVNRGTDGNMAEGAAKEEVETEAARTDVPPPLPDDTEPEHLKSLCSHASMKREAATHEQGDVKRAKPTPVNCKGDAVLRVVPQPRRLRSSMSCQTVAVHEDRHCARASDMGILATPPTTENAGAVETNSCDEASDSSKEDHFEGYTVERITDVRVATTGNGRKRLEFLVKWDGWEESSSTWEPTANVVAFGSEQVRVMASTAFKQALVDCRQLNRLRRAFTSTVARAIFLRRLRRQHSGSDVGKESMSATGRVQQMPARLTVQHQLPDVDGKLEAIAANQPRLVETAKDLARRTPRRASIQPQWRELAIAARLVGTPATSVGDATNADTRPIAANPCSPVLSLPFSFGQASGTPTVVSQLDTQSSATVSLLRPTTSVDSEASTTVVEPFTTVDSAVSTTVFEFPFSAVRGAACAPPKIAPAVIQAASDRHHVVRVMTQGHDWQQLNHVSLLGDSSALCAIEAPSPAPTSGPASPPPASQFGLPLSFTSTFPAANQAAIRSIPSMQSGAASASSMYSGTTSATASISCAYLGSSRQSSAAKQWLTMCEPSLQPLCLSKYLSPVTANPGIC